MTSGGCRWACAALMIGVVVLVGAPHAAAAPAGRVLPVGPVPSQHPADLGDGDVTCPPILICDPLGNLGADAVSAMAQDVVQEFSTIIANSVGGTLDQVSAAIAKTTEVNLDASWFEAHFKEMRSLALLVLLPMVLVGIISAVIHRDANQLWRAGGVYVPVAIVGGSALIILTDRALQVTDWATTFVTGDLNASTQAAIGDLKDAVQKLASSGAFGLGIFLADVVLLVLMAGALLVWIELLLRTDAIYVVVLFLPIAMSGLVWRATVAWTRRMIEMLVALILSKFVIVVVIDLAASMVTAGDGIGTVMQGATLLLLAACAPFALLRLVPIVEAGVISQFEGMEHRPIAAGKRMASAAVDLAVLGAESSAGAQTVADNGGDSYGDLSQRREPGGQLNDVQPPAGWSGSGPPDAHGSEPGPDGGAGGGPTPAALPAGSLGGD